jgi:hypothetical protein
MVFVFVGHMIPFLSRFLLSEEVTAEVEAAEAVVDGTVDKREAGRTEATPNTLALMEILSALFICASVA